MYSKPHQYHFPWLPLKTRDRWTGLLVDHETPTKDRCAAAYRLSLKGGENAFKALARAAYDQDFWLRAEALQGLERLRDMRCLAIFLHSLSDPEPLVSYEASLGLKSLYQEKSGLLHRDLVMYYQEGSARGRGVFHAIARPEDITLNILNRPIIDGRGIDLRFKVNGRQINLHECGWEYRTYKEHGVLFCTRYPAAGVELQVTLECGEEEFFIAIEAILDEPARISDAQCDLYFVPEVNGPPLLPSNGLESGPSRRFIMGDEVLMRRCEFGGPPHGLTLDITGSPFFRQIAVNPSANERLVRLLPTATHKEFKAGKYALLMAHLRPHPTPDDFDRFRGDQLERRSLRDGEARVELIGSTLRVLYGGKNVLGSSGVFLDLVNGEDHYSTFFYPLEFVRRLEPPCLEGTLLVPEFGLAAVLAISIVEGGRVVFRLRQLSMERPADELVFGLLLSRRYVRWRTEEQWHPFLAPLKEDERWKQTHAEEIEDGAEISFRTITGLGSPALKLTLSPKTSPAQAALKTTSEFFNARSVEMHLPAKSITADAAPTFVLETEQSS